MLYFFIKRNHIVYFLRIYHSNHNQISGTYVIGRYPFFPHVSETE